MLWHHGKARALPRNLEGRSTCQTFTTGGTSLAEEDDAQKTEDPTAKKLSDARDRGEVAQSQEIKTWAILLGGTFGVVLLAPWMARGVRDNAFVYIARPESIPLDMGGFHKLMTDAAVDLVIVLLPLMMLLVVMGLASNIAQVGLKLSIEKIQPDLSKISVLKGIKRMFSMRTLVEFLKGIFKITIVGIISFGLALTLIDDLTLIAEMDFLTSLDRIHMVAILLLASTVLVMTVIAIADYIYQRMEFMKKMRMTQQEVKDENKNAEGDPLVKSRIRQIRMERARQRMMQSVPDADVVITNPTHYSVALQYDIETMPAPIVVAKGVDELAFRIREVAKENDVPLVENAPLARALFASVDIDEEIPAEHFAAIAEIIGFVMRKRGDL